MSQLQVWYRCGGNGRSDLAVVIQRGTKKTLASASKIHKILDPCRPEISPVA